MSFFENFEWSFKSVGKIIGFLLLGVIAVTVVIALFAFSLRTIFQPSYNNSGSYEAKTMQAERFMGGGAPEAMPSIMPIPDGGYTPGTDAESFEVKEYTGYIKTSKLDKTCGVVAALKTRPDVIFEASDQNQDACHFRFKVKKENEAEIVKIIEGLKPESLNLGISTIKKAIEGYDTELDILKKKLASIEDTLDKAQNAYDELTVLATRQQDVKTLSDIINNKLNLISTLTNERIAVKEQIDRSNKDRADQLDRLNYVYFNIDIQEDLLFDWKQIKDSWRYEVKAFVDNFNNVIQGLTINLAHYLIRFAEVTVYLFISLILIRIVWAFVKRIWNR